jgi:hypothetical protein
LVEVIYIECFAGPSCVSLLLGGFSEEAIANWKGVYLHCGLVGYIVELLGVHVWWKFGLNHCLLQNFVGVSAPPDDGIALPLGGVV